MAFNSQEQEIIKYGLANGKTKEQVTQALTNFRLGIKTKPEVKEQGSISKAFQSGVEQAKQGYEQAKNAKNPLELLEGGTKLAAGAVNTILSPTAPIMKPVEVGINAVANKISDNPEVQKLAGSKAGEIVSRITEDIANLNTIVGAVAGVKAGAKAPEVAGKVVEGVKPAISATGKVLKAGGEASYGVTVTAEEATRRALQSYQAKQPNLLARVQNMLKGETKGKPITEANTAARKGLVGTEQELGVQAKRVATDLWKNEVAPKLKANKEKINMQTFLGEIKKEIQSNPDINRRKTLLTAFNKFALDNKKVGNFGLEKLQDYKVEWAKFIPESYSKSGKAISGSLNEIRSIAKQKASQIIFDKLGEDTKMAYIDYGNLKSIMESGIKAGTDPAKQSLSRNVWQFIMDKTITPVVTIGGKVLYRTGEGLEFIGQKGAKKVSDIVK